MTEETYELRFESESLHIIPVGGGVAAQLAGDQIVTILPDCLDPADKEAAAAHPGHSAATAAASLLLTEVGDLADTKQEAEAELVIQHGHSWLQDILNNLQHVGEEFLDFPVFCRDGIFWSNKVILASLAPYLKDSLQEDSCILIPDFIVSEFAAFHESLFRKDLVKSEPSSVPVIAQLFGFGSSPRTHREIATSSSASDNYINYVKIFRSHKEEYIKKVVRNSDIANHVLSAAQQNKKINVTDALRSVVTEDKPKRGSLECYECNRIFDDEEMFQTHQDIVHSDVAPMKKLYSCQYCPKQFSFQVNVRRHMYLLHPNHDKVNTEKDENVPNKLENSSDPTTEEVLTEEIFPKLEKFRCNICGKFLKSKRYLVAHIQV